MSERRTKMVQIKYWTVRLLVLHKVFTDAVVWVFTEVIFQIILFCVVTSCVFGEENQNFFLGGGGGGLC